jgi:hypothetical protein
MMSKVAQKNKKKRAKKKEPRSQEDTEITETDEVHNPIEELKAQIEEAKLAKYMQHWHNQ